MIELNGSERHRNHSASPRGNHETLLPAVERHWPERVAVERGDPSGVRVLMQLKVGLGAGADPYLPTLRLPAQHPHRPAHGAATGRAKVADQAEIGDRER